MWPDLELATCHLRVASCLLRVASCLLDKLLQKFNYLQMSCEHEADAKNFAVASIIRLIKWALPNTGTHPHTHRHIKCSIQPTVALYRWEVERIIEYGLEAKASFFYKGVFFLVRMFLFWATVIRFPCEWRLDLLEFQLSCSVVLQMSIFISHWVTKMMSQLKLELK